MIPVFLPEDYDSADFPAEVAALARERGLAADTLRGIRQQGGVLPVRLACPPEAAEGFARELAARVEESPGWYRLGK